MAEIHMEKKRSGGLGWLWILLALLLIALLAWAFWPDDDVDVVEPVAQTSTYVAPVETPATTTVTLAEINQNPAQWVGREYSGTVTVPEVPTDRGFWIEENGTRMFAVVYDAPREDWIDINPGQQLRLRGTVRDQAFTSQMPGEPMTAGTQNILENQQAYLVVGESAIEILQPGQM